MKNADLVKRIEELERQVRELQARPVYIPVAVPMPNVQPWAPAPSWPAFPNVWCTTDGLGKVTGYTPASAVAS